MRCFNPTITTAATRTWNNLSTSTIRNYPRIHLQHADIPLKSRLYGSCSSIIWSTAESSPFKHEHTNIGNSGNDFKSLLHTNISRIKNGNHRAPISSFQNIPTTLNPSPTTTTTRQFSIRTKAKNRRKQQQRRTTSQTKPLLNEKLTRALLRKKYPSSPNDISVRLVTDSSRDVPSEVCVISLADATKKAHELSLDLMGVNLNHDPPVVKAIDYGRLMYDTKKKVKNSNGMNGAGGSGAGGTLKLKEFRVRAGIAPNDLNRKTNDMVQYLTKGHACQLTVYCRAFLFRKNQDVIRQTVEMICEMTKQQHENHELKKTKVTPRNATLLFQPKKG